MKFIIWVFLAGILILPACKTDYGVTETGMKIWIKERSRTALDTANVSQNTKDFLLREDLFDRFNHNPENTLKILSERLRDTKDRKLLYILIELAYLQAKNTINMPDSKEYIMGK